MCTDLNGFIYLIRGFVSRDVNKSVPFEFCGGKSDNGGIY